MTEQSTPPTITAKLSLNRKLRAEIRVLHLRLRDANRGAEKSTRALHVSSGRVLELIRKSNGVSKRLAEIETELKEAKAAVAEAERVKSGADLETTQILSLTGQLLKAHEQRDAIRKAAAHMAAYVQHGSDCPELARCTCGWTDACNALREARRGM